MSKTRSGCGKRSSLMVIDTFQLKLATPKKKQQHQNLQQLSDKDNRYPSLIRNKESTPLTSKEELTRCQEHFEK